jgi:hypothetical protein
MEVDDKRISEGGTSMFAEYVPSILVALVTIMLVALAVLAVIPASMDRRGLVYHVVGLMGMTSLATACLVGLFVLFLIYGPVGRDPHHSGCDAVPTSNQMSTDHGGSPEAAPSQIDTSNAPPACDASAERQKS